MHFAAVVTVAVLAACCTGRPTSRALGEARLELSRNCVIPLAAEARPIAEVRLSAGRPLHFLLDTGAEISLLDGRCARELGLELLPYADTFRVVGSGGTALELREYVHLDRLSLGELVVHQTRLTVVAGEALAAANIDGILGQDLLARLVLVVDMQRHAAHLLSQSGSPDVRAYLQEAKVGDGAWVTVTLGPAPCPLLPLEVAGVAEPVRLALDTGAIASSLPKAAIVALHLQPIGTRTRGGVDGTYATDEYHLENFNLFGLTMAFDVTASPLAHGLLGMDVLGSLVLVLDGPARTLWLHHRV